jgi:hypothetical protein
MADKYQNNTASNHTETQLITGEDVTLQIWDTTG